MLPQYGALRIENVSTQTIGKSDSEFYISKVAAKSSHYPETGGTPAGFMVGVSGDIDIELSKVKAYAELVEHSSAFLAGRIKSSEQSIGQLRSRNDCAVLPDPIVRGNSTVHPPAIMHWAMGTDLSTGENVFVPSNEAFLLWKAPVSDNLIIRRDATGLAAHTDPKIAIRNGLLEIVERETAMLAWCVKGWPVAKITDPRLNQAIASIIEDLYLRLNLYCLYNGNLPPTYLAILSEKDGSKMTIGTKCDLSPNAAIEGAIKEALMLRWTIDFTKRGAVNVPRNCFEHVVYAYQNGAQVIKYFEEQCCVTHTRDLEIAPDDLVSVVTQSVGSSPIAIDVRDSLAQSSGWSVFRVFIPTALPRVSGPLSVSALRAKCDLLGIGLADDRINQDFHPFG